MESSLSSQLIEPAALETKKPQLPTTVNPSAEMATTGRTPFDGYQQPSAYFDQMQFPMMRQNLNDFNSTETLAEKPNETLPPNNGQMHQQMHQHFHMPSMHPGMPFGKVPTPRKPCVNTQLLLQ